MKFAVFDIDEAAGAILAHTVHIAGGVIKKGRLLTALEIAALRASGVGKVMAARLEADDVAEDEAAARIAAACRGAQLSAGTAFTGRANLMADAAGLAVVDRDALIALNALDEGLTVATVAPFGRVAQGQLVATIKIIPFALPGRVVADAETLLRGGQPLIAVAPFAQKTAGLIVTRVAGMKPSLIDKRVKAMRARLEALGCALGQHEVTSHGIEDVAAASARLAASGHDPILLFGASAIVDRGDVIPQALVRAGGSIVHVGMPVDPGNLLMVGRLGTADVIGVPSCATSPKLNGFDWVLERLLAGLAVGRAEIVGMAPGGLLTEIAARPQPRGG